VFIYLLYKYKKINAVFRILHSFLQLDSNQIAALKLMERDTLFVFHWSMAVFICISYEAWVRFWIQVQVRVHD